MQLAHIDISKLSVSPVNMRSGKKPPDLADILPSVRARGILVPLLVRQNGSPETFEIVAGRRRYFAAKAVVEETSNEAGEGRVIPCAIMEAGDDAAALEASLLENVARLDAHEVEQWATFTGLVKAGRSAEEIALVFGLTDRQVRQVLALGNLLPKIRELYRKEEIDPASIRYLTMATKAQQREWLAMVADPDCYAPGGVQLKNWLLGGQSIATGAALFDLQTYKGEIVADLFGEDGYFADANAFWEAQNAEIEARRAAYLEAGWAEVMLLDVGDYFNSWEHEKAPKRKGGKVFVQRSQRGEVIFHEGYLPRKEARRLPGGGAGGEGEKPVRPEVTGPLQTYIDLHRHAAVRAALLDHKDAAFRLLVAHAISGSHLFSVRPEPQRAGNEVVQESVETSAAETLFDARRREVLALLGFDADAPTIIGGDDQGTTTLFARLLPLADDDVLAIAAVVMGEALEAGSVVVEAVAHHIRPDMAVLYRPDAALVELVRDKEVLCAMLAEVGGEAIARANQNEKAKTLKGLIVDHLEGANGRTKAEVWLPRWMAIPPAAYTGRGGVGAVRRHTGVAALFGEEADDCVSADAFASAEEADGDVADGRADEPVAATGDGDDVAAGADDIGIAPDKAGPEAMAEADRVAA
ncbi:ParB/RepB/Spo0J family partition protein [Allosphingosinicella vermicomposti]|uniref:ParB/RepB/Spo0J family partition protein n=1 Tax=Allosphingosinicella vermicomposti TaxID=614671 RepID=UPI000D110969|nr:ParB/RepB/Spo0J family partition protein [Allosphingosinicella vermicomposti]